MIAFCRFPDRLLVLTVVALSQMKGTYSMCRLFGVLCLLVLSGCANFDPERAARMQSLMKPLTDFHPEAANYVVGPNPPVVMQQQAAPRTCNSMVYGQMITTNCY
jgi:hypothetical protein